MKTLAKRFVLCLVESKAEDFVSETIVNGMSDVAECSNGTLKLLKVWEDKPLYLIPLSKDEMDDLKSYLVNHDTDIINKIDDFELLNKLGYSVIHRTIEIIP